jgi:hypothetical protein
VVAVIAGLVIALSGGGSQHPAIALYGAPGSFGSLAHAARVPGGMSFSARGVSGWGFLPGQSAYFTAVGPDGTVFMANEPQNDNQLMPTAQTMAISAFNPSTRRFRNVVIPTSTGVRDVTGPWPSPTLRVGGADVADIGPVSVDGATRIAFLSAAPYEGWGIGANGVYPTLGYLRDRSGGWIYDGSRSVTALKIAGSATSHTGDPCTQETSSDQHAFADCRLPTEFDVLPRSHDLIVTQYASNDPHGTSGGLMVLDPHGRLVASYAFPKITLPSGDTVDVHPREVDADPTSPLGTEHFTVIFDSSTGSQSSPFAMQELEFKSRTRTIRPVSAPILSGETAPGGAPLGFETAQYDSNGNLWAAQSQNGTLTGGPIAIYRRRSNGNTIARPGCSVSATWSGDGWGTTCPPDQQVRQTSSLGIVRSLNLDPTTHAMLIATASGYLLPVLTRDRDRTLRPQAPVDLGLNDLADRSQVSLDLRKGSINPATRTLYLPLQQLQNPSSCQTYPCLPADLNQWLYAIDLRQVEKTRPSGPGLG